MSKASDRAAVAEAKASAKALAMILRLAAALLAALALPASAQPASVRATAPHAPVAIATELARWQLRHVDDAALLSHMTAESKDPRAWEQAVFWLGMTALADAGGPPDIREAVLARARANQWLPGRRPYHADDLAITQSYLWAARHGAGPGAIAPARKAFGFIVDHPPRVTLAFYQPPSGYDDTECLTRWCWCDALFMAPPAMIELSRQTGDRRFRDYALREYWATTDFLFDPAEHLFYRDSRFFVRRDAAGRKLFWSRGNGWVFAGMARIIPLLEPGSPDRKRMVALFREMAAKLRLLQKPDGYWAPSLLAPEGSPPESSGTGFYTYGLAWGIRAGLLDRRDYEPAVRRGWDALVRAIQPDGRLGWVQQVSDQPDRVEAGDTQFYGVGAFLLAASAVAAL